MKRRLFVTGFLFLALNMPAQVLGTGVTPTVQIQDADALSIQERITSMQGTLQSAIDRASQITQAVNTLLTLNQSLQYQIQAAEALAEGSWEGFVDFFDYQTAAIGGFTSSILNVNEITDAFSKYSVDPETGQGSFAHAFDSDNYERLKQHAVNINRSMAAANDMVRSTDSLIDQTERSYKMIERGVRNTSGASSPLQALQGQAQILAAIAGESASATQLMYSQQRFLQTVIQNTQETNMLNQELTKEFIDFDIDNNPYYTSPEIRRNVRESLSGKYLKVEVPNWP
jgi:conjugal transfer/entry exclusion protein